MGNIVEEKGTRWKIFCYRITFILILLFICNEIYNVLSEGIFSVIMLLIFWGIPSILVLSYFFSHNSHKITITSETLIAERIFCKNSIIPLDDISKIEKRSWSSIYRFHYVIKYYNKSIILNPYYFRKGGVGFDDVMIELQRRVEASKNMDKIIQEEGTNGQKIYLLILSIIFTIIIIKIGVSENIYISILPVSPLIFILLYAFSRSAFRITISNELLIIERFLFNTFIVPLENIDMIKETHKYKRPHGYYIMFDNKKIFMSSKYFRPMGVGFDKVINELEIRIISAKSQKNS